MVALNQNHYQASALSSKLVSVIFWNIIFFCKAKFVGIAIATAKNFNAVEGNKKQK